MADDDGRRDRPSDTTPQTLTDRVRYCYYLKKKKKTRKHTASLQYLLRYVVKAKVHKLILLHGLLLHKTASLKHILI